jgi:hypothetical protein
MYAMPSTARHAPAVLFIHDGSPIAHIEHLKDAGLRVSETRARTAVAAAKQQQPDISCWTSTTTETSARN